MAKVYDNAAVVAKDNDGNTATFRGGSKEDWEKISKGLQQIPNLNEAVLKLKECVENGLGTSVEVAGATDAQKGVVQLTDDPKANKDAATGVTAITPKAIQAAMTEVKEEAADAEVELNDATASQKGVVLLTDDPKANKDAATGVTAITPKAIQAAVSELQEQIAEVDVEIPDASNAQKGITFLTDDYTAEKDAATGVTAITPKAIQAAVEDLKGKIEAGQIIIIKRPPSPFDEGFGVGVAPTELYESLNLKPLAGTEDKSSFQYGLYEVSGPDDEDETYFQSYHAYLKYIPKFYHCLLSTDDATLMDESQLKKLIPYTGLTVAQMKQAQERAGTAAIALAPASVFENEADANAHGFILNRGYYDDGKEKPGFFIANTQTIYFANSVAGETPSGKSEIRYYHGAPEFNFVPPDATGSGWVQGIARRNGNSPLSKFGIAANFQGALDLGRKIPGLNCMSAGMWQVIRMICFAAGLYAKDNAECGWFRGDKENGFYCAAPCGINNEGTSDVDITSITTSPAVSESTGTVWISDQAKYPYTTHNGRINGITNCNGWCYQPMVGTSGNTTVANISMKLADVVNAADALADKVQPGTVAGSGQWGKGATIAPISQPFSRDTEHTNNWYASFLAPILSSAQNPVTAQTIFGKDNYHLNSTPGWIMAAGYYWTGREYSGVFSSQYEGGTWTAGNFFTSSRIGGYPEI